MAGILGEILWSPFHPSQEAKPGFGEISEHFSEQSSGRKFEKSGFRSASFLT